MEGVSGMSVLQDLLGGDGPSGGGGVPVGGLIKTHVRVGEVENHKIGTKGHYLTQADYTGLHGLIGELPDNAPFQGLESYNPLLETHAVPTSGYSDPQTSSSWKWVHGIAQVGADHFIIVHNGSIYETTNGVDGDWVERFNHGRQVYDNGYGWNNIAAGNGYCVISIRDLIYVNTVQNDYSTWTSFNLGTNGSNVDHTRVSFLNGMFFVAHWSAENGGSATVSHATDPTAEINWTDSLPGFLTAVAPNYVSSVGAIDIHIYWLPEQAKYVIVLVWVNTTQDYHHFRMWTTSDPSTGWTENPNLTAYQSVNSTQTICHLAVAWEKPNGDFIVVADFLGLIYGWRFSDVTAAPDRVLSQSGGITEFNKVLDVPEINENGEKCFAMVNQIPTLYDFNDQDGVIVTSDAPFVFDTPDGTVYPAASGASNYNGDNDIKRNWIYDATTKEIVSCGGNLYVSGDYFPYVFKQSLYNYDNDLNFWLPPVPAVDGYGDGTADSDRSVSETWIYQTRVL
jgi:hypothetical protein